MSIINKKIIDTGGGGGVSLPINISDVNNLQNSLDNKANQPINISDVVNLQTSLNNKANSPINISDVVNLQTSLNNKANSPINISDVANLQFYIDKIIALENSMNRINYYLTNITRTGFSLSIPSNATALTNLKNIVVGPGAIFKEEQRKFNGTRLENTPTLISIPNGWKVPIIPSMELYGFIFRVGITGSISGSAGTPRELVVYLRRISDNSIVSNAGVIKINDNNFNGRGSVVISYVSGPTDPFITDGFYIDMLNNSQATLTLTGLNINIQGF